jgi:hypothetical protein
MVRPGQGHFFLLGPHKHFAEDYPQARLYLLYRGDERLKRDGILCLPAQQFLVALKPDHFPE